MHSKQSNKVGERMAEVKAKVPRKKASKRQKKDWIAAYILIAPVTNG